MLRSLSARLAGSRPWIPERGGSYDILPTNNSDSRHSHALDHRLSSNGNLLPRCCTKPIIRLFVAGLLCLFTLHFFFGFDYLAASLNQDLNALDPNRKPSLYTDYYLQELRHPQHNPNLPYPEGGHGQYIWYANHVHGSGWGNAMQEHLLNAYLAHESGRAFVYNNYTWNRDGSDYTDYNGHLIPSRIPIAALLQGPTAGGSWPSDDLTPRAVVKEYWDKVCPEPHAIVSDELLDPAKGDADEVLRTWVEKLKTLPRCVEITGTQIWNIWIFGSKRVLAIWDSLKKSPVITGFRWSQLIEDGFVKNRQYFMHTSWLRDFFTSPAYPYDVIPGLLVLHIRRGDFEEHCMHFARWGSQWNGFNQFPELPDQFVPPPGSGNGQFTEEGRDIYLRHCFPDIDQIVARVAEVRATPAGRGLKDVYIMTNGKQLWVEDLTKELATLGGWDKIASSKDLQLSWDQQFVAQSIDMLIGQRAQVIIGNGFSSLTSNIVMLRMAKDIPADTNRFW
ncbi:hypothetical protein V8D89_006406 [Ganoderma adspersum]